MDKATVYIDIGQTNFTITEIKITPEISDPACTCIGDMTDGCLIHDGWEAPRKEG